MMRICGSIRIVALAVVPAVRTLGLDGWLVPLAFTGSTTLAATPMAAVYTAHTSQMQHHREADAKSTMDETEDSGLFSLCRVCERNDVLHGWHH